MTDCGSNVGWLTNGIFPCLRPGNKYLLLQHGKVQIANGLACLAVQGFGLDEVDAFELLSGDDALLRGLAGNACSANIAFAFLVASLLVL